MAQASPRPWAAPEVEPAALWAARAEERSVEGTSFLSVAFAPAFGADDSSGDEAASVPSGAEWLVAGSSRGAVHVWRLDAATATDSTTRGGGGGGGGVTTGGVLADAADLDAASERCRCLAEVPVGWPGAVYSVAFAGPLLLCGGDGGVAAFAWSKVRRFAEEMESAATRPSGQKDGSPAVAPAPLWARPLSPETGSEVNAVCSLAAAAGTGEEAHSASLIFAAGGDAAAYVMDMETQRDVATFRGHEAYIHSAAVRRRERQLVTASEDGTVRLWDVRTSKEVMKCENGGSWVGSVAIDETENWMVYGGGGGRCAVWHLPSACHAASLTVPGDAQAVIFRGSAAGAPSKSSSTASASSSAPSSAAAAAAAAAAAPSELVRGSEIVVGGNASSVRHFRHTGGEAIRVARPNAPSVFALATSPRTGVVVAGGAAPNLDLFNTFGEVGLSLTLA